MLKNIMTQFQNLKSIFLLKVMAGVRTPISQYASCVLLMLMILCLVFSVVIWLLRNYVAQRAGIGINAGRIRGINARIRGGEVHIQSYTFPQKFESNVKCCTQNGVRGGSATFTSLFGTKK